MGPLLVKALINFAKARAAAKAAGVEPANIGHGVGIAFDLLIVIVLASICQHQFFFRSMITGVLARTALTGALYRLAVHLTPSARLRLPNSAVLNHVSMDVSRVDACAQWFHAAWTVPIPTTVCFIILLVELGPSALAGFALFLLIIPLQERIMAHQFALRQGSIKWTDERARRVLEVVASMRVKYLCYEGSFLARLFRIRTQELTGIRKIQHSQSANIALAFSLSVLAATLAFVTSTETSNSIRTAHESTLQNKPATDWPAHGAIEFKDAGEKIGVVGRAGAGKSSLTLCLLRIVEYLGEIIVDGVNIGKIGLTDLRSNITIIPQEPILFSGTVRTALDSLSKYDDAQLWDAFRRSYLNRYRLTLDSTIETDGQNLSVSERSLLSLARALVKDSRVVILDEATASVDLEMDNKIRRTIHTQFKDRTLICIAYRLRTIISYDRILVLDAGKIAEFDTPLNLFN
ncbi:P-loop containing nucleoside triphosphate hydrolase protein [Mycena leptocephala]|nr:P-loop containing nucleoside triphosphate hydrolase protein [Mycena leptocephala]